MPAKLNNAASTKIHGGACPFITQASPSHIPQTRIAEKQSYEQSEMVALIGEKH